MKAQAPQSSYDVVVVGGGLGGLTSGALLAKEGKRVLVVEQEENPGGFAREFRYGPYNINPALHAIMGCNPSGDLGQGVIDAVLNHLGVQDQCEFISINPFYRVQFPDFQLDVPTGREAYLEAHIKHFPSEADGLRNLVDLCSTIFREFMQFSSVPRWQDWASMPIKFPNLFRNATATVNAVMNRHLSDPKLKSVYAILYPYLALPPSRLSFLLWGTMMASYIEQGAFYCPGGFQNLADALAAGITKHGGDLILGTRVSKIQAANGKAKGIVLESGQEISSPLVVSNIDARATFYDLIDEDQVPSSYLRKLRRLELSGSVLGLYLATDLDIHALEIPKVSIISSWDLETAYAASRQGRAEGMALHIPTLLDSSLAPTGEHIVVMQAFVPEAIDLSPTARNRFAASMLNQAEKVLPALRKHITFVASAATEEQEKYPLHRLGPIYGWANSVWQAGPLRLPYKTPLSGLYLAGHWTQPGSGIWTVVLSGINAARYVLKKNMSEAIWPINV
jgi:prolycopene isomerase